MVMIKRKVTLKTKKDQSGVTQTGNLGEKGQAVQNESPKSNSGNTKWLLIVIAVILVVVVVLYLRSCGTSSSEDSCAAAPEPTSASLNEETTTSSSTEQSAEAAVTAESAQLQEVSGESKSASEGSVAAVSETQTNEVESAAPKCDHAISKSAETKDSEISAASLDNTEAMAKDVIRGLYGNGNVRKEKLGDAYTSIQNRVNEMYRQGLVR